MVLNEERADEVGDELAVLDDEEEDEEDEDEDEDEEDANLNEDLGEWADTADEFEKETDDVEWCCGDAELLCSE